MPDIERFEGVRRFAETVNAYGETIKYQSDAQRAEMVADFNRLLLANVLEAPGMALMFIDYPMWQEMQDAQIAELKKEWVPIVRREKFT